MRTKLEMTSGEFGARVVIRAPRVHRAVAHRWAVRDLHSVRPYWLPRTARITASVKTRVADREWRGLRPYWHREMSVWAVDRPCRCAELRERDRRAGLI